MRQAAVVSSSNPHFAGETAQQTPPSSSFSSRPTWQRVAAVLGTVAVSVGVGVAIGLSAASSGAADDGTDGGGGSAGALSAEAQAQATLEASFSNEANAAVLSGDLNVTVLNDIVSEFENDPENWEDQYLPAEVMRALVTLRDSEAAEGPRERLRRELATSVEADPTIVKAWEQIRTSTYPNALVTSDGEDQMTVYRTENSYCWVIAQESNSGADVAANLDLGNAPILSMRRVTDRHESCPCERTRWFWCARRALCNDFVAHGEGFEGFVKPYNELRLTLADRISATCRAGDEYVFTGTSRGAAIVTAAALAVYEEELLNRAQMKLITFGSPRVLTQDTSDAFHNKIDMSRLVYRRDPVPSLPYTFMGYRHVGDHICNSCPYESGRNRPQFAWGLDGGIDDHTQGYDTWLAL